VPPSHLMLLTTQFFPVSLSCTTLPRHSNLEHPQPIFLPD
jgi:hypothetical protein